MFNDHRIFFSLTANDLVVKMSVTKEKICTKYRLTTQLDLGFGNNKVSFQVYIG